MICLNTKLHQSKHCLLVIWSAVRRITESLVGVRHWWHGLKCALQQNNTCINNSMMFMQFVILITFGLIARKETRSIWKMLGPFATTSRLTPIHQVLPLYCRTPPAHRCPQRQRRRRWQRQRVTEGTAMAPWNGPKKLTSHFIMVTYKT